MLQRVLQSRAACAHCVCMRERVLSLGCEKIRSEVVAEWLCECSQVRQQHNTYDRLCALRHGFLLAVCVEGSGKVSACVGSRFSMAGLLLMWGQMVVSLACLHHYARKEVLQGQDRGSWGV